MNIRQLATAIRDCMLDGGDLDSEVVVELRLEGVDSLTEQRDIVRVCSIGIICEETMEGRVVLALEASPVGFLVNDTTHGEASNG